MSRWPGQLNHGSSSVLVALCVIGCLGCRRAAPPALPQPPPQVTVVHPQVDSIIDYREYTGRTGAIQLVDIRARVGGYLEAVEFKEGTEVRAGDLLFRIDPRPVQQQIRQAEANLAAQQALVKNAELDLARARNLITTSAISQADLDQAISSVTSGQAQLKALEAAVARAQLDLEYTEIRSPIAGRTGRALVTPGNLVVSDVTVLTSVVSTDPIFAYFDVDESSALDYRLRVRSAQVASARDTRIDIALGLANESGYPHPGYIDFVDNVTDAGTGNIMIRGRFPNSDNALLPGLFVRVQVPFTRSYEALLVPQTALAMNQQGRYVLTVDGDNRVVPHVVQVGSTRGDRVVIRTGLTPQDRVIVSGLQKARPGSIVQPTLADSINAVQPKRTPHEGDAPR